MTNTEEDKDLSTCVQKSALPLFTENELAPLECNALNEDFNAFKDAIDKTLKVNIELIRELPPPRNFTLDEVLVYFEKELKSGLEKDEHFEKSVEVSKYANSIFDTIDKYFNNIFDFHEETKSRNNRGIRELSKYFLNSDLDEEFLRAFSTSFLVTNDFLDLFDNRIRREHRSLTFFKNNVKKFERVCLKHNQWVHDFQIKLSATNRNRVKLLWYTEMNNCRHVEELFKDKLISKEVLNEKVLNDLIQALDKSTTELEVLVLKNANLKCLHDIEVDDGINTITSLMDLSNR